MADPIDPRWSTAIFIGVVVLRMFTAFFMKAYRRPREVTWLTGLAAFAIALRSPGFTAAGFMVLLYLSKGRTAARPQTRSILALQFLERASTSMSETPATPTVVIGAGPAGVSAAPTLARAGVSVVLVERSDTFGGKVRTVNDAERRYEHGMHGWWPCYVNFDRMLRWAGVEPAAVLHPATDLRILVEGGRHRRLRR